MRNELKLESDKLTRSWMQHDSGMLRDYLVVGVEDPRLNLQSIFSRHFLIRNLTEERYVDLMEQEYRFAAAMAWLGNLLLKHVSDPEELELLAYGLTRGADNVEGMSIPRFAVQLFGSLPATACGLPIPNYIGSLLRNTGFEQGKAKLDQASLDTFLGLWRQALAASSQGIAAARQKISVLEPACGSANDYRFLDAYGIAPWLDYTGIDLCSKNIENALALFPNTRFEVGNAFCLAAPDNAFDLVFVHDLFEHFSITGLETAVSELCRITRWGMCVGFFNMDEIPEHLVRPLDEYHWNTLSMARMKELFLQHGFTAQVLHVGTFLRQRAGYGQTHNPNAYTFSLRRL
jgi:ubiquinone/menaquinone biosynthesis C-methylase UbiE